MLGNRSNLTMSFLLSGYIGFVDQHTGQHLLSCMTHPTQICLTKEKSQLTYLLVYAYEQQGKNGYVFSNQCQCQDNNMCPCDLWECVNHNL